VKTRYRIVRLLTVATLVVTLLSAVGCNKKSEPGEGDPAVVSVAVTNFYLKANAKVMHNLDSVFFSIDFDNGIIFNADSLPKGTNVETLIPMITYPSYVEEATITMSGGNPRTGGGGYKKNPSDSIDFSGDVRLDLKAADGTTASYRVKVNVHRADPDSLMWNELAAGDPMRPMGVKIVRERSVAYYEDGFREPTVYPLAAASDGRYYMVRDHSLLDEGVIDYTTLDRVKSPDVSSLSLAGDTWYLLDGEGNLYKDDDPMSDGWLNTGEKWVKVIGGYGDRLLGIRFSEGRLVHTCYPRPDGFVETPVSGDFPVMGSSNLCILDNKWSDLPTGLLFGGRCADGSLTGQTWGYDGEVWAKIAITPLPAAEGIIVVPYHYYRQTTSMYVQTEYDVWIAFGGELADGSFNRTVYISYDNGVNWSVGSPLLQFPDAFPSLKGADYVLETLPMDANLTDAWKKLPLRRNVPGMKRIAYDVDGYEIRWECPYIFILGGHLPGGDFNTRVWRGVLARLTFAPLI